MFAEDLCRGWRRGRRPSQIATNAPKRRSGPALFLLLESGPSSPDTALTGAKTSLFPLEFHLLPFQVLNICQPLYGGTFLFYKLRLVEFAKVRLSSGWLHAAGNSDFYFEALSLYMKVTICPLVQVSSEPNLLFPIPEVTPYSTPQLTASA